jgi:hypothetical protein
MKQKIVENLLCWEILPARNRYCHDFLLFTQFIDMLLYTCNIKSHLFLLNHDFVFPRKTVETEAAFFHGNFQLLSIELIQMFEIDEFFQL